MDTLHQPPDITPYLPLRPLDDPVRVAIIERALKRAHAELGLPLP